MNALEERMKEIDCHDEQLEYQSEFLKIMNRYNSTDRKTIKQNYKRILDEQGIQPKYIMELGYARNNVYSWSTISSPNIPMFPQALSIAVFYGFDVREFLKEI